MGTEVWALIALILVLTMYLLPTLVGRRELLGHARAHDRYSATLRLLDHSGTGGADEDICGHGAHDTIFRRPPEVRAMNRPAVRHVRALRTQRELDQARQAHQAAREARRVAAQRRLIVACSLLGVAAGVALVCALTTLPWLSLLVPAALLGTSMVAGRRAALAGAAAERAEQRKIASLEEQLSRLTGVEPAHSVASVAVREALHAPVDSGESAAATGTAEVAAPVVASEESTASLESAQHLTEDEGRVTVAPAAEAPQTVQARTAAPATHAAEEKELTQASASNISAPATERVARAAGVSTATPPQGWKPVHVPAPTYTLAATARARKIADLADLEGEQKASAPVPARPTSARTYAPAPATPAVHPIDLDAVLARRRAAGE